MVCDFDVVVATDLNGGIGKGGSLPWKLSADMRYFKELTTTVSSTNKTNAVIMGRKTWESIPANRKPLAQRINVVLTRAVNYPLPDTVLKASSLAEALASLEKMSIERCFVIGGGEIYKEALSHPGCRGLYVTEVRDIFDCDTFFPKYKQHWTEISSSDVACEGQLEYCFKVFKRKQ
ncbi:MAG: dihydrofolate reductase [Candidatus Melainabacteria bacterium]|nr:dihydrofolate reductase [Candidatus Melainabacteria bacterium]